MFNKKDDKEATDGDQENGDVSLPPLKPFSKKGSHVPTRPPSGAVRSDTQRRNPTIPGGNRSMDRSRSADADSKSLVVGRDICLNGEITACERLIVHGQVEVKLSNARLIEVSSSGFFNGVADVSEADIDGRFDGELIAHDKLIVRANGRITGAIRYGSIVIEAGGQISGDMQTIDNTSKGEDS